MEEGCGFQLRDTKDKNLRKGSDYNTIHFTYNSPSISF